MKKRSRVPIIVVILAGMLLSIGNVFFCIDYTKKLHTLTDENEQNPISVLFDWQANMIQQFIRNVKNQLKSFAMSSDVIDLLKDPNNAELTKKSQAYTERYFANLDGWEGLYIEDWNTKVLTHSIPETVGMVVRKNDTIEQFRSAMTDSPEGLYFSGAAESPASGEFVMSFCYMVTDDNGKPIGLVGGAPYLRSLSSRFSRMDMSSANVEEYAIINSDNCLYSYHSDNSFIGQEVMDSEFLKVVDRVNNGGEEGSYTRDDMVISYRALPDTNFILAMKCNEKGFVNNDKTLNIIFMCYFAVVEVLLVLIVILGVRGFTRPKCDKSSKAETVNIQPSVEASNTADVEVKNETDEDQ